MHATDKTLSSNLPDYCLDHYNSRAIIQRLSNHACRLFVDEGQSALDLLELEYNAEDFWPNRIQNAEGLKRHLDGSRPRSQANYKCRFLFIHATHSRAKLEISQQMFTLCFAHFQLMPDFVDFLLPFGRREYAEDFYFSGFRQESFLAHHYYRGGTQKSGAREFQLCYNLKSVEPSGTEWSIRHCVVHHAFNLAEVKSSWIVVKGNDLMRQRIQSATGDRGCHDVSDFQSVDRAFEASFKTHLMFCEWSTEHWRCAIHTEQLRMRSRSNTQRTEKSKSTLLSRTLTQVTDKASLKSTAMHQPSSPRTYTNRETGYTQPLPPQEDEDDNEDEQPENSLEANNRSLDDETQEFSFGKLRKVHAIAEKVNEAILVLKQNIVVLSQLRCYYCRISERKAFPANIAQSCKDAIDDFAFRLEGFENDMQIQILRLETLLSLVEDRKTLLHSILEYQNTQANKHSTYSMVTMTEDMKDIARKTKIETVSMKVITLVTLFFLPGTFISVGRQLLSTLMSTDIFQLDYKGRRESNPYVHLNPVQIYLALSLPLTMVTLSFWAAFHFWEMRREKQKEQRHKDANAQA